MAVAEVHEALATGADGLSDAEARARLAAFGPNQIEPEPPTAPLVVFLRQFRSPLILILLVALVVTVLLGEHLDAGVIGAVLGLNAGIGFVQERKAETAVRALRQLVVPHSRVLRQGRDGEVDSRELVTGDVVLLESGMHVPADLRLVSVTALQVDESLLTGESLPVTKRTEPLSPSTPVPDRACMAYTGTTIIAGRGRGVVVATGERTELGAIAGLMRGEDVSDTPLQRRMNAFARIIGSAVVVAALVALVSGVALGEPLDEMFLVAVALAVSAVPEGLPIAVTITLAIGVRRMAARNAIVRRLHAVETLGSTTVIGSDKTGTLTENRMTVRDVWTPGHDVEVADGRFAEADAPLAPQEREGLALALLAGVLTNEAPAPQGDEDLSSGDPTEVALLRSAMSAGIDVGDVRTASPVIAETPFEPARQYSASLRERDGRHALFVKGAPERIVAMCTEMLGDEGPVPIDTAAVDRAADGLAAAGRRVLAFAYRILEEPSSGSALLEAPERLTLLGLQGMVDPPRPGVRESVLTCQDAGIRVVMVTGDHAETARAIALELGIATRDAGEVLTGSALAGLGDSELSARLTSTSVYARVSPEDKLRIVRALQDLGEVVAVTGDGVNDAPALKAAEIGIAMGRKGTDVAREAAEMVLADDAFDTIIAAVEGGRVTFDNIRKVTFFLVSTGAAEVAAILTALWLGWPLVLLPAQLLWLNLVTNGLQDVALAFEPAERHVLRRQPRAAGGGVLDRIMWERVVLAGLVMGAGTLAVFSWELEATGSLVAAQTAALTTMVVYQVFQAGNARSERASVLRLHPFSNPFLFLATAAALSIHVAALHVPATQYVLRVEPIDAAAWVRIVAVAASILVAMEVHKLLRGRRSP